MELLAKYAITRGDRYKYLRVKATYSVNSEVDTVYTSAVLVPLESMLRSRDF